MTGFGDASQQVDGVHYSVEARSLNNRYFKPTIRLPEDIAGLEAEFEALLRRRLTRGSITLTIKTKTSGADAAQQVNDAALLAYLERLNAIQTKLEGNSSAFNIDLTALLGLPGVLSPSRDQHAILEKARPVLKQLVGQACDRLITMRQEEGAAIARDFDKQRGVIHQRLEQVKERVPLVIEQYHQRLKTRVDDLLARAELKVDEKDLLREVAIFAERADISEEISRLSGHLDQFEKMVVAAGKEPVGRTLDFLTQELLREANTIASKSNDELISRAVVEMKGAIDRIKEQAQNVE
jgi:uncharacterized protein (TIGR00255 family)